MGLAHSPSLVTDGLMLCLDAGNPKSYTGSGSTWYDLSGRENNGTLTIPPSYSSDNLGAMVFDGTDDYVSVNHNAASMDFSLAQTICIWMKPNTGSTNSRRNPYNQAYGGPGTLTHEPNQTINYYFGTNGGNSSPYVGRNSGFTVAPLELAFITFARDQTTDRCKSYKNGNLILDQNAGGYATTANGTSAIWIGGGYAGRFLGNIYNVMVYNIALSSEQVRQNYEALRGRFGL